MICEKNAHCFFKKNITRSGVWYLYVPPGGSRYITRSSVVVGSVLLVECIPHVHTVQYINRLAGKKRSLNECTVQHYVTVVIRTGVVIIIDILSILQYGT